MTPLIFLVATLIGGSNAAAVKFTLNQFPTDIFIAFRSFIAFVVISPLIFRSVRLKLNKFFLSLLIVNVLFTTNWFMFALGVQRTSVIMSQLIYLPTSLVVGILSFFILKEKLTKNQTIGLVITTIGGLILIIGSATGKSITFGTPIGNIFITLGLFCWALYYVLSRNLSKVYSPLTIIFFNFLISFIIASFLIIVGLVPSGFNLTEVKQSGFLSIIYVGIFSSATYFYLNQWLIKHTSAFISSLQQYPTSLIASILGIIFFRERLTLSIVSAALLIMLGVFIATSYGYIKNKLPKLKWI